MPLVEKKVRSSVIVQPQKKEDKKKKKGLKLFKAREAYIPSTLTKLTNSTQIKHQYTLCNAPPALWKMETVIADDCVAKYSHPGLFGCKLGSLYL